MGMHIRKGGKFMKLKKKSGLMGAVIALSAASLVSVGFASWVISQGETESFAGTITVDDVQMKFTPFLPNGMRMKLVPQAKQHLLRSSLVMMKITMIDGSTTTTQIR